MAAEIVMPKLGLTMTEGTIEKWFVKEGDDITTGDVVAEISSEKLTSEVEANEDGTLIKITAEEGDTVKCKEPIGYIGDAGEEVDTSSSQDTEQSDDSDEERTDRGDKEQDTSAEDTASPSSHTEDDAPKQSSHDERERVFITPLARKMAEDRDIDIRDVNGTGGNGRITKLDINRYVPSEKTADSDTQKTATAEVEYGAGLEGMRKTIAERMMRSVHTSAHVTNHRKVDITKLMAFRQEMKERTKDTIDKSAFSINTLLVRAVVLALKDQPEVNSWYYHGEHTVNEDVHIGMATAVEEGLVVPVIKQADTMTVSKLGASIKEVTSQARSGTLPGELYSGSTFSITSLGGYDIEYFTPIINTPEVAILGVGTMQSELKFDASHNVVEKQLLPLSLSYDHQIIDGAPAADFLQKINDYLQNPYQLIL
jgi:pyruvate dehydrogenase E2 component (dihydrolipoamide acetyltransferase)